MRYSQKVKISIVPAHRATTTNPERWETWRSLGSDNILFRRIGYHTISNSHQTLQSALQSKCVHSTLPFTNKTTAMTFRHLHSQTNEQCSNLQQLNTPVFKPPFRAQLPKTKTATTVNAKSKNNVVLFLSQTMTFDCFGWIWGLGLGNKMLLASSPVSIRFDQCKYLAFSGVCSFCQCSQKLKFKSNWKGVSSETKKPEKTFRRSRTDKMWKNCAIMKTEASLVMITVRWMVEEKKNAK